VVQIQKLAVEVFEFVPLLDENVQEILKKLRHVRVVKNDVFTRHQSLI
jgi:hypothetical protein